MENKTLMTDFYELTMAQTYFNEGKQDEEVYFDIFFRNNPFEGGYTISGGLEETINYIKNFKFDDKEIEYLRGLNTFTDEFLDYFGLSTIEDLPKINIVENEEEIKEVDLYNSKYKEESEEIID